MESQKSLSKKAEETLNRLKVNNVKEKALSFIKSAKRTVKTSGLDSEDKKEIFADLLNELVK